MKIKTIELKGLKVHESMSEETNCYEATVYVNGRKAFLARNHGHGGCDVYQTLIDKSGTSDPESIELLQIAHKAAQSLPPLEYDGIHLPMSLELMIGKMVEEWRKSRHAKRMTKNGKRTLARTPDMDKGEYRAWNYPLDDKLRAHILAKYPDAEFLNDTPDYQPICTFID